MASLSPSIDVTTNLLSCRSGGGFTTNEDSAVYVTQQTTQRALQRQQPCDCGIAARRSSLKREGCRFHRRSTCNGSYALSCAAVPQRSIQRAYHRLCVTRLSICKKGGESIIYYFRAVLRLHVAQIVTSRETEFLIYCTCYATTKIDISFCGLRRKC